MPKVCIHCGQDCSDRPRVRDPQGRYACKACLDRQAAKAAAPAVAPADPLPLLPPDLVDDAVGGAIAIDTSTEAPPTTGRKMCPSCSSSMPHDAVICVQCGYNSKTGFQAGTGVGADSRKGGITKCPTCGYSLKGLKTRVCPECGKEARPKSREQQRKEDSRAVVVSAYRTPILMFVIGAGLSLLILTAYARSKGVDPGDVAIRYLLTFVITVPCGLVAYFIACMLWMGFNAPFHLTALQLAGVYAVTDVVYYGSAMIIPIAIVVWALSAFMFFGLLVQVLELDVEDAIMVWVFSKGVSIVAVFFVLPAVLDALGYGSP